MSLLLHTKSPVNFIMIQIAKNCFKIWKDGGRKACLRDDKSFPSTYLYLHRAYFWKLKCLVLKGNMPVCAVSHLLRLPLPPAHLQLRTSLWKPETCSLKPWTTSSPLMWCNRIACLATPCVFPFSAQSHRSWLCAAHYMALWLISLEADLDNDACFPSTERLGGAHQLLPWRGSGVCTQREPEAGSPIRAGEEARAASLL